MHLHTLTSYTYIHIHALTCTYMHLHTLTSRYIHLDILPSLGGNEDDSLGSNVTFTYMHLHAFMHVSACKCMYLHVM